MFSRLLVKKFLVTTYIANKDILLPNKVKLVLNKLTRCVHHQKRRPRILKPREEIFNDLINGNRSGLAVGITLVESTLPSHFDDANFLLAKTLTHLKRIQSEQGKYSFRIGFSGSPGAGKSSLIETFGTRLTNEGHKVAVLAIDPSSVKTGGSLLGDRTRMTNLAHNPNAFIRPSPTSGTLGGVTKKTNEAIILCEGAGYDVIFVETVGIGQSELAVADMVDIFVLIIQPASGDELQGIKKGVVEVADLILINKADGDLLPAARKVQAEYVSALKLLRRPSDIWTPRVYPVSALQDTGFERVWKKMQEFQTSMQAEGHFYTKRSKQQQAWMWNYIQDNIMELFMNDVKVQIEVKKYEHLVQSELMTPSLAAKELLEIFNKRN